MEADISNDNNLQFMQEMLTKFDRVCRENNLQYWLDFETLQAVIDNKSDALQLPIKISMLRNDYKRMWAKIDATKDLYTIVSQNNANIITKIFSRTFPDDCYIEVIPYDYIDVDFTNKKQINKLNKAIQECRKALDNIYKREPDDCINYLNSYRNDILENRQEIKNAVMVGLDYNCKEEDRITSVGNIFPLQQINIKDLKLYLPHKTLLSLPNNELENASTDSKISVVIHTFNNEKIIKECLESVKGFDEIVICDMYSTDKTLEIAKEYNAKIVMHENVGYVEPARNYAVQQASNEWVLIVDSDERITKELRNYLYNFIDSSGDKYSAVRTPRKNYFWNILMEMQYPDYVTRFAKKDKIYWPPKVHAHPEIDGEIYLVPKEKRELAFIHYTCDTPTKFVNVINKYTDCEVEKLLEKNKKCNIYWRIFQSFTLIFEKFFLKGGWKNGVDGFILCVFWGFYKFLMYVKYYETLKGQGKK